MSSAGLQGYFDPSSDPTRQALIQALQGGGGQTFQPGSGAYGAVSNGASSLLNRAVANQVQKQLMGNQFMNNRLNGAMGSTAPNMDPAMAQQQVQMPVGLFGGGQ